MNTIEFQKWFKETLEEAEVAGVENPFPSFYDQITEYEAITLNINLPKIFTSILLDKAIDSKIIKNLIEEAIISHLMKNKQVFVLGMTKLAKSL